MINSRLFLLRYVRTLCINILCCLVFLTIFVYGTDALAAECDSASCLNNKCSDGNSPSAVENCSGGMCGICSVNDADAWSNPRAEILYMVGKFKTASPTPSEAMPIYRGTIALSECQWLLGIRFCVRTAKGKALDAAGNQISAGDPGNNTDKPMICGYEDPMDGMDTERNSSPYHQNTARKSWGSLLSVNSYYNTRGGILGTFIGLAYNHVVNKNIGCVDRRIGPMPPKWSNEAWFNNSIPPASFEELASGTDQSIFESPKVKVMICKDGRDSAHSTGAIVSCDLMENTPPRAYIVETVKLTPNADVDTPQTTAVPTRNLFQKYRDCKATTTGGARIFCATVTTQEPDRVRVSVVEKGVESIVNSTIKIDGVVTAMPGYFLRPGYMPMPTVMENASSVPANRKMDVTLRGKTVTLSLNSTTQPPLHQVAFGLSRTCLDATPLSPTNTVCSNLSNKMCLTGYEAAPLVAINAATKAVITGAPNQSIAANAAFDNTSATKEVNNSNQFVYLRESFLSQKWMMSPAATITNAQTLRPLTGDEMALCLYAPADTTTVLDYVPGRYNRNFENCTQVQIEVWGGGAAGGAGGGGGRDYADASGGAGGYVSDVFDIPVGASTAFEINVGDVAGALVNPSDGEFRGGADGNTSTVTYAGGATWTATGGQNGRSHRGVSAGGRGSVSGGQHGATGLKSCIGGNGSGSNNTEASGGTVAEYAGQCIADSGIARDSAKGYYHEIGRDELPLYYQPANWDSDYRDKCRKDAWLQALPGNNEFRASAGRVVGGYRAFGAGGCSGDDTSSGMDSSSWGIGGPGHVRMRCLRGSNP